MSDLELDLIKAKLLWAAGGDWSVPVSPTEAKLLLETIYPEKPTGTVDRRPRRIFRGGRA